MTDHFSRHANDIAQDAAHPPPFLPSRFLAICLRPLFGDFKGQTTSVGEEVRVDATNMDSGSRSSRGSKKKTWRSEEETRKTGLEYNNERRDIYDNSATASSD